MKTRGLQVLEGYVCPESIESAKAYGLVPVQFWNRLKHRIAAEHRIDDFRTEALVAKGGGFEAEIRLFMRWSRLVGFEPPPGHYPGQRLWPWTPGWTSDLVDSYLTAPSLRVVA